MKTKDSLTIHTQTQTQTHSYFTKKKTLNDTYVAARKNTTDICKQTKNSGSIYKYKTMYGHMQCLN